ncbi:DUF1116 domain-containing protein [Bordetella muralis]|uniref:oxamate carbamoyltransferase subunit AllG family protein n=1 Tax=Bordetella muralis TaxID=1649130 RepID=UPI0039EFB5F5
MMPSTVAPTRDIGRMLAPLQHAYWADVVRLRDALPDLDSRVLLHAGPAYAADAVVPVPVMQAAAQAVVFEGAAADVPAALQLLASGAYRFEPAQNHGVVTPLAQVVSSRMPMAEVRLGETARYAPLLEAGVPSLRFGSQDPSCVMALHVISRLGLGGLAPCLRSSPLAVAPWLRTALQQGDECHSRTGVANQSMIEALVAAFPALSDELLSTLSSNPNFVLTLIMAACACVLETQDGDIKAAGGNGVDFGVRMAGESCWRTVPATAPIGCFIPGLENTAVLGAIGDSAVVDFCGLGGQALSLAPALLSLWQDQLPTDAANRARHVLNEQTGLVCARSIAQSRVSPIVHLAMVEAHGVQGLAGRGFYAPPVSLFTSLLQG